LDQLKGYGGVPRRPILGYKGNGEELMESLKEVLEYEEKL
jgi:L-threo-3-deoxy-hexylosonate aldolase